MTNTITSLLLILLLSAPIASFSKEKKEKEKKMNKKEMKAAISGLNDNLDNLKKKVTELEADKAELQKKVADLTTENDNTKKEVSAAKAQVETAKQDAAKAIATVKNTTNPSGLTFKVQIGAYQAFKISTDFDKSKNIATEDVDGFKKYIVGYFGDLDQATAFTKDVKKMGIQDAWIVPYNDGKRISDAEAEQLLGKPFRDKNAKAPKAAKKAKETKTADDVPAK